MNPHADRLNNFDFLRILAASLVLFSHQFALTGSQDPVFLGDSVGNIGVLIFFSISGFLVAQSWRNDPNWFRFVAKRLLRIWPGLALATLLAACVLGPLVSTRAVHAYFADALFPEFLQNLKLMSIRYYLPGVFETNLYPKAVNGSLWTIPLEIRCYMVLSLLGLVGALKRRWIVLPLALAFAGYYFFVLREPANYQYQFAVFFLYGVALDAFRETWQARPWWLVGPVLAGALLLSLLGQDIAALALAVPALVATVGTASTPVLRRFGRFGDLSYGIYIYAFPVQQSFVWAGGAALPFAVGLVIVMAATAALAWLSWHAVEGPALSFKPRRRSKLDAGAPPASTT